MYLRSDCGLMPLGATGCYRQAVDNGTTAAEVPVPWSHRLTERHWVGLDAVVSFFLAATSIAAIYVQPPHAVKPELPHLHGAAWDAVRVLGVSAAAVALPFRRRRPETVLAICAVAMVLLVVIGFRGPILLTVPLAMYTVANRADRRTSRIALGLVAGGLSVAAITAVGGPGLGSAVTGAALTLIGWLAGENMKARRAYTRGVAERAAGREREREARIHRAAADERMRIARELHDVVAHTMSVIAVRSGVARAVLDSRPEEAGEALAIIEQTSRQALQEMRHLVGVLRQGEDPALGPADLGPAPGLADLTPLLEQVAQAGVTVTLDQEGRPRPLPPGIDLSAYRIIQEGLTNVVRHGGGGRARLRIRYQPADVEIEITNPVTANAGPTNGEGGHGLVGMRERVALYGGELRAGPTPEGFQVLARLPAEETAAS
jgi:signal transduction histidine kinase